MSGNNATNNISVEKRLTLILAHPHAGSYNIHRYDSRTAGTVMVSTVLYLTSELPSVIIEKTGNTSTISFFV